MNALKGKTITLRLNLYVIIYHINGLLDKKDERERKVPFVTRQL